MQSHLCSIPCTLQGTGGCLGGLSGLPIPAAGLLHPDPSKRERRSQVGTLLGIGVEFLIQLLQQIFLPW